MGSCLQKRKDRLMDRLRINLPFQHFIGSSEIWSDKASLLHNKAYREAEENHHVQVRQGFPRHCNTC
ncbi:hypothetical protein HMPREF9141_1522 [Prevotella multiformis DSM 16608]|uniref:Uncharacterized protein n=1 Tax=Prevotella multiformis DSM 16608 TaxID=888743 RepID=F0F7F5_9BACT|nr:hypothetical protein HMPREF9141_1522 [Prevotella multiformis DSM 16608]